MACFFDPSSYSGQGNVASCPCTARQASLSIVLCVHMRPIRRNWPILPSTCSRSKHVKDSSLLRFASSGTRGSKCSLTTHIALSASMLNHRLRLCTSIKRCVASGFSCGYPPLSSQNGALLAQLRVSVAPAEVDPTSAELELNFYFRQQLIPQLDDELNSELWHVHILQAALDQAAIWHTCNSLAAVHRQRLTEAEVELNATPLHKSQQTGFAKRLCENTRLP